MPNPTRNGKIASLPVHVREELCTRLLDGQGGPQILPWLNALPEVLVILDDRFGEEPITPQNLSEWRKGGYQDWLGRGERAQGLKTLSGYALKLAEAAGGSLTAGGAAIAGGRILELLENAADDDMEGLVKSLVLLRSTDLEEAKRRDRQEMLALKNRQVSLEETRFQRHTAELFLKWYADQRAKEIVQSPAGGEVKMKELVQLMFGEAPTKEEEK